MKKDRHIRHIKLKEFVKQYNLETDREEMQEYIDILTGKRINIEYRDEEEDQ